MNIITSVKNYAEKNYTALQSNAAAQIVIDNTTAAANREAAYNAVQEFSNNSGITIIFNFNGSEDKIEPNTYDFSDDPQTNFTKFIKTKNYSPAEIKKIFNELNSASAILDLLLPSNLLSIKFDSIIDIYYKLNGIRATETASTEPGEAEVATPAPPSTTLDAEKFFALGNINNYQAVIANGNIEYSEVEDLMSRELFDVIDNNMKLGKGNGQISETELNYALTVIKKYAEAKGISETEAAEAYFETKSFRHENLDALIEARNQITSDIAEKEIDNKETLINLLTGLGYSQDTIDATVALIAEYNNVTTTTVVNSLMSVVFEAHAKPFKSSRDVIAWLQGRDQVNDEQIKRDIKDKKIFSRTNQDREGTAMRLVRGYIGREEVHKAERALEIITEMAEEKVAGAEKEGKASPYQALCAIGRDSGLNQDFARAYLNDKNYEKALEHARLMAFSDQKNQMFMNIANGFRTEENYADAFAVAREITDASMRDQVFQPLFDKCVKSNDSETLGLAFQIARIWENNQKENLVKVAQAFVNHRESQQVRDKALAVIAFMKSEKEYKETGLNLSPRAKVYQDRDQRGQQIDVYMAAFEQQIKHELILRPELREIERDILTIEPRETQGLENRNRIKLNTDNQDVFAAVEELDKIIAEEDNPYNLAYARYLRGLLYYGIAKRHAGRDNTATTITFKPGGQNAKTITVENLYFESMYELAKSWEIIEQYSGTRDPNALLENIFGRMIDITQEIFHAGKDDKKKNEQLAKEVANFVPESHLVSIPVLLKNKNKVRNATPSRYRTKIMKPRGNASLRTYQSGFASVEPEEAEAKEEKKASSDTGLKETNKTKTDAKPEKAEAKTEKKEDKKAEKNKGTPQTTTGEISSTALFNNIKFKQNKESDDLWKKLKKIIMKDGKLLTKAKIEEKKTQIMQLSAGYLEDGKDAKRIYKRIHKNAPG